MIDLVNYKMNAVWLLVTTCSVRILMALTWLVSDSAWLTIVNDVGAGLEEVPVRRRDGKDGVSPVEVESEVFLSEIEAQLIYL